MLGVRGEHSLASPWSAARAPPQVRARWNHAETTFLLFLVVGFGCGSLLQKPNSQPPLVAGEPGYRIPGASFSIYRARFEV